MNTQFFSSFHKIITLWVLIIVTAWAPLSYGSEAYAYYREPASFVSETSLLDPDDRIHDEFKVPKKMHQRTAFWFDIYTRYGAEEHIIHHTLYPWIIYRVVDTRPIFEGSAHRWTKYHHAKRVVRAQTREIAQALRRLAKRKSYNRLSPVEQEVVTALSQIPGSRKKVYKEAAANLRTQLGQKDYFIDGLRKSARYLPVIENEFAARGLPTELTRLPFVESSFNVEAESKVGASGIWQIMPRTGKSYLLVTDHIDERNSPLKASLAATQIFLTNYKLLRDWPLAITAYNHGAGGIKKALRISHTTNLPDLIEKYHAGSFKFASSNFYACFLAALHAEKYHREIFNDLPLLYVPNIDHHVVSINKPIRIRQLLQKTGLSISKLLEYNLDLRGAAQNNARLPKGYRLILPAEAQKNLEREDIKRSNYFKEAAVTLSSKKPSAI
jgi:membrane-bound lytic murein transglycosylase D